MSTHTALRIPRYAGLPKRLFDLAVFCGAHLILLPLWVVLWTVIPLLIIIDDGPPVFFRQRRVGRGGNVFTALKFRTMVRNADQIGPARTLPNDPRLTRMGKLLRATALDELPQVLNVLRGEMSFVGPRALSDKEVAIFQATMPGFAARLAILPGLTGLAQVYNKGDNVRVKLRYDLIYLKRMSLWLDIKLLLVSVFNSIRGAWDTRQARSGH